MSGLFSLYMISICYKRYVVFLREQKIERSLFRVRNVGYMKYFCDNSDSIKVSNLFIYGFYIKIIYDSWFFFIIKAKFDFSLTRMTDFNWSKTKCQMGFCF